MDFNIKAFALTSGLLGGAGLFGLTVWMIIFNGATGEQTLIGMIFPGYSISLSGCFIGGAWGLVSGLAGGIIFPLFYNIVNRIFPKE